MFKSLEIRFAIFFVTALSLVFLFRPFSVSAQSSVSMDRSVPCVLSESSPKSHPVSLKLNVLPLAAAVPAIGLEFEVMPHWSVNIPVMYSPYFISDKKGIRILSCQPELRRWLRKFGAGHFFGIHLSVASYNIRHGKYRYQDNRIPAIGAGVSYGYVLKLYKSFSAEFSLGAGYINTKYDRFLNMWNGKYVDTRKTSYFGIDNASISIIYSL